MSDYRSIQEIRSRQGELKTQRESFVAELERLQTDLLAPAWKHGSMP
jgi:hypothetical protein